MTLTASEGTSSEAKNIPIRSFFAKPYRRLSFRGRTTVEVLFAFLAPLVVGYIGFALLLAWRAEAFTWVFWLILGPLLLTSLMISIECARAARFPEPRYQKLEATELPVVGFIVPAFLPNEEETLIPSLKTHLAQDYPADKIIVMCVYNGGEGLPLETELTALAEEDSRLIVHRVKASTSKAENINEALLFLKERVGMIAIFDADHHSHPLAARRAARWLTPLAGADQFDMVQGQCSIRNTSENFLTKLVGAEFVTLYAVAHPGRTVFNDFGIFGGSNGWWRAEIITELAFDKTMLTEDIDATARALSSGYKLATDPRILSTELAPETIGGLWKQRMRWAQGWLQVSQRYSRGLVFNKNLSGIQKRGVWLLFVWRVIHPWLAALMLPLLLAKLFVLREQTPWDLLIFIFTGIVVNGIGILQAYMAKRLAPPSMRGHKFLFTRYAIFSVFYAGLRSFSNRAAVLREWLKVDTWEVTSRQNKKSAS